jgi:hypothetical protein
MRIWRRRVMDESSPLNKRKPFFVLTSYNSEESEGEQSAGGSTSTYAERRQQRRTLRPRSEKYILKCVDNNGPTTPEARAMRESFHIVPKMEGIVKARLKHARESGDPTPVIIAFTLIDGTRYGNVINTGEFEKTPEYLQQRTQPGCAVGDDQLCVDMQYCKRDYKGIVGVLLFLRSVESGVLHTVIERQSYKTKNTSENLFERLMTPSLKGYYYKVLVDFAQC